MRFTFAYSKIKKRNLVLINNDTHQRETLSERPIRPPLRDPFGNKPLSLKGYPVFISDLYLYYLY